MAVYIVKNGQLKRVAEDFELHIGLSFGSGSTDDYMSDLGFTQWDDVGEAYVHYQRGPDTASKYLPGIHYIFLVGAHGELEDYILISDSLPDFLAVIAMLEPLRIRDKERREEVDAELLQSLRT